MTSDRHVALLVGDLRAAEDRGAVRHGALVERGADAGRAVGVAATTRRVGRCHAADVEIAMVALRRDQFVLALFAAEPSGRQTYALGLVMDENEIEQVSRRLRADAVDRSGNCHSSIASG